MRHTTRRLLDKRRGYRLVRDLKRSQVNLLKVAGYVAIPGDPEAEEGSDARRDSLVPGHRNLAVYEIAAAQIDHLLNRDL